MGLYGCRGRGLEWRLGRRTWAEDLDGGMEGEGLGTHLRKDTERETGEGTTLTVLGVTGNL